MVGGIVAFVLLGILLLILCVMRKRIAVVIQLFK